MGASAWKYIVPFCEDLDQALSELRAAVFASGDYYWYADAYVGSASKEGRPDDLDELWDDEDVQEEGTHSILDMQRIADPGEDAPHRTIVVTSAEEAEFATGSRFPTRAQIPDLEDALTEDRWVGRCAVLYSGQTPTEVVFWGISGD